MNSEEVKMFDLEHGLSHWWVSPEKLMTQHLHKAAPSVDCGHRQKQCVFAWLCSDRSAFRCA